ncbi:MAG: Gfo/Idh/MocA family oxidoreductase [Bacteroidales bacterium]|nr:Gfo/Idh/MocA family oxidoreductase [Bacteroidales bacterium]
MIRWGIIGTGNVTEVKSGPAFNKAKGSKLVAVMRRDLQKAKDYARRHNVPKYYINADDLINDNEVDAVYIATPPDSHAGYAIKVLEAGKPVYIEKPMALNYEECLKINRTAEKHQLPVYVAYYRRTLPGFLKIKNLIESGEIGKLRFVNIQLFKPLSDDEKAGRLPWRVLPEVSGGGHFFDLACHQLDYLDFLLGPVQKVNSLATNLSGYYKAEDFVTAGLTFPGNISMTGTWCFCTDKKSARDVLEFFGEEGMIQTSTFTFEPIIVTNKKGRMEFVNERPENVQFYLIQQIVDALHGKGEVVSTGITAARTSRVMDEVVKEYYGSKKSKR